MSCRSDFELDPLGVEFVQTKLYDGRTAHGKGHSTRDGSRINYHTGRSAASTTHQYVRFELTPVEKERVRVGESGVLPFQRNAFYSAQAMRARTSRGQVHDD